jgi:hypothetical protein
MTEFVPGGRRRIDRVLSPDFLTGIGECGLEEIRTRRADADQEEVDLSYARRLLQGRLDILRAEQVARAGGTAQPTGLRTDAEIVGELARILADEPRADHGLGRHMTSVSPSRIGEHRREAERAVADLGGSDPSVLTDEVIVQAIAHLSDIEQRVSRTRRQVQQVVDSLTQEIARRYQAGEVTPVSLS